MQVESAEKINHRQDTERLQLATTTAAASMYNNFVYLLRSESDVVDWPVGKIKGWAPGRPVVVAVSPRRTALNNRPT